MSNAKRAGLTLFAAGLFAAGAVFVGGTRSSIAQSASTTELSAQQNNQKKPAAKPAGKPAPRVNVQRRAPPRNVQHRAPPRNVQRNAPPRNVQRNVPRNVPHNVQRNAPTRAGGPPSTGAKIVTPGAKVVHPAGTVRTFTPRGPRAHTVTAGRLRGMPGSGVGHTSIRGRNYSVWRRGYRVRHGGAWRTFVALSALGALAIGGSEFYPYAYITAPEDYCDGLTPDGCELVWQDVETEEGDVIPQCVAYC